MNMPEDMVAEMPECTKYIAYNMIANGLFRGLVMCEVHGHHNPYDMYKKGDITAPSPTPTPTTKEKDVWEEEFDYLPVYLRSKFSRDCSRNETEDEKSTEMVEREQVIDFIRTCFISKSHLKEQIERMHECWCGGGKHFMKSRCVVHTSECALNNQGYYEALNKILKLIS